jgi:signal transduction histidine kinase/FixJ family two-component response regulator
MITHFWKRRTLAVKLTLIITFIVVLVVAMLTVLSVRREQQTFKRELEQQATLLLDTLTASSADSLYFLDADFLSDLMINLGQFEVVTFGRIYDADGRIVADALDLDARFSVAPDPFGQLLLQNDATVYDWQPNQLIAGKAVELGGQRIGAIGVGLPTAPLTAKLNILGQQVTSVASIVVLIGLALALLFSRSITDPLQDMIKATQRVREGDLSQRLKIVSGDELALLGEHFNDMTAQLENTLNQMEAEIEERKRAQAALEAAKEVAESANRAKSTFLANMSHELRTPLNAILGFAELIARDEAISALQQENLQVISRSGEHLLDLINQVLDMSKIEAGRMTLNERDFDLYRLLTDLETMFQLKAQENRIRLIVERHPDTPQHVRTDEVKLRQILINLLNNAFKFTETGYVMLRIDYRVDTAVTNSPDHLLPAHLLPDYMLPDHVLPDHVLMFSVEDSGPGIQPEDLPVLFDAFVQAKAGRELGGGTGLGLSLSRQFAQLLGGDMSVRNVKDKPGYGAIFQFYVRIQPLEDVYLPRHRQPHHIVGLEPGQPTYRLLVVDDNRDNRQILVRLLAPLGFEIREAENGRAAIEEWQAWRPHLIWMDLHMPVLNGYEATRRIKNTPDGQQTVIIATTATAFTTNIDDIAGSGCDNFIRKPVQANEIFEVLQQHLGVRYLVETAVDGQTSSQATSAAEIHTLAAKLATLPPNLLEDLRQAAIQTNMTAVALCLDNIRQHDPWLAQKLKNLADDFEYDKILLLLPTNQATA